MIRHNLGHKSVRIVTGLLCFIASVVFVWLYVHRVPPKTSNLESPRTPDLQKPGGIAQSQEVSVTKETQQFSDSATLTQAVALKSTFDLPLQEQIAMDGYDLRVIERFEKTVKGSISQMEKAEPNHVAGDARATLARMRELAEISSEPRPRSSLNFRVPGTAFSGMRPEAIKDPVRREAYEKAIEHAAEENKKRTWLIQAHGSHNGLVDWLEAAINRQVERGALSGDVARDLISSAKAETDKEKDR